MYFNDVHILIYTLIAILGMFIGNIIDYVSNMFIEYNKTKGKKYFLTIITAIIYVLIVYKFGIYTQLEKNIELIKILLIIPILISIVIIDYKKQIIPNRLNLLIFEIALFFIIISGWTNIYIAKDLIMGGLVGSGIFLAITLIGGLIAGKEAMGLGDVKLMGALGLCFGVNEILLISVLSFFIGAIISIILLISRKKKTNQYIPFGPFIIIATIINIFIPFEILFNILIKILSLGIY